MSWTAEWPTEKGSYWFYGKAFAMDERERFYFVEVRHGAGGIPFYVTNGHFLYASEGASGAWQKAELPPVPRDDEVAP